MERKILRILIIVFLIVIISTVLTCSDPTSSDKAIVKILIPGRLFLEGEYVIFWDGTNKKNEFVPAGTYYARLYSRDFTEQLEITALAGGTGLPNGIPGLTGVAMPQAWTELKQNAPNPFRIQDGTNIPFTLSDDVTIELTIRDKE